jgi:hypothetical protein
MNLVAVLKAVFSLSTTSNTDPKSIIFTSLSSKYDSFDAVNYRLTRMNIPLNAGQRAIAFAKIYPEPGKRGRKAKGKSNSSNLEQLDKGRLSEARLIVQSSDTLADEVLSGATTFNDALNKAKEIITERKAKTEKLERLKTEALDLYNLVQDENLTLDDVISVLDGRIKKQEETNEKEAKLAEGRRKELWETIHVNIHGAFGGLLQLAHPACLPRYGGRSVRRSFQLLNEFREFAKT